MPDLTKSTLKEKKAFQVGEGLAVWANIHVHDLSDCFLKLVEAAASGGGNATWDKEGYYFTENGEHAWGQMSKLIAEDASKKTLIPTDEVATVSAEDADRFRSHGFFLWGVGYPFPAFSPPLDATLGSICSEDILHTSGLFPQEAMLTPKFI